MILDNEYVVLVDEADREIGVEKKSKVHSSLTPLHRAFSIFYLSTQKNFYCSSGQKQKKPGPWCGQTHAVAIPCPENHTKKQ